MTDKHFADRFEDLLVWQKSMDLVEDVYKLIHGLPTEEKYSLGEQMRRSAISIPSNIAEGFERNSNKDFVRFLSIANGSKSELYTQIVICQRLGYTEDITSFKDKCNEIGRMLVALIHKLNNKT